MEEQEHKLTLDKESNGFYVEVFDENGQKRNELRCFIGKLSGENNQLSIPLKIEVDPTEFGVNANLVLNLSKQLILSAVEEWKNKT